MKNQTSMPIEVGIKESDRFEVAKGLSKFLADTYTLYLKTQRCRR